MEWLLQIINEYGFTVALVCYVIWDSRQREGRFIERENKYISIIESVKEIKNDVEDIKQDLKEKFNK
ncbi:BhlA/UviB family holin-like peptide [Evansella cellulosilytica]|uniref:UviB protein n=1 Tax=Evansella cellulosilytica (strain ATCC 21833 / DSM 2522 / FERM P-1141 / JCM 9156 / N-4) TaxID=649639 RepID=E6U1L4_EVAC2|nr:BhlA/UviB family holin-like peptide [Evansella cellulosilytica]ADU30377.1 UviB protein [Evansella cellulosilytica DSM 2522]